MSNLTRKKRIEVDRNGDRDRNALHKLMNNGVYGKNMGNWGHRTDVRLVNNKESYLKWTSKPTYISQKSFDNDLVVIRKGRVTLTLSKPA